MKIFDTTKLNQAFQLLNEQLELRNFPLTEIVVCGGSALIASQLVSRTTQDVDIVAMLEEGKLVTAQPLPSYLIAAAKSAESTRYFSRHLHRQIEAGITLLI